MNTNLSPSIQQLLKMVHENPKFRTGLQACSTQDAVVTYLKSNNISVTPDEISSFTKSDMNKDQSLGGCIVNW